MSDHGNLRHRSNVECSTENGDRDFPATYIVVQFAKNIRPEAAQWLVGKVQAERRQGGAELLVARQPVSAEQGLMVHVSAGTWKLLELAEELELRKRDMTGLLRDFTLKEIRQFTGEPEELLTSAEKQGIVRHELMNIRALAHETFLPAYPAIQLYEGQSIFAAALHWGLLHQVFPLHDQEAVRRLGHSWFLTLFNQQPFEDIRLYFGESVALYFQFIGFYTTSLIGPMLLGFYQLFLSPETLAFFCIFNIIWATVFLELWRRKCSELAFVWGTFSMTSMDEPRPNFLGVMGRDAVTGRLQPQYPRWKTYLKMYCVSLPLVMVCMSGAFVVMLCSFWLEDHLKRLPKFPSTLYMAPSVIYAGLIYLMNSQYRKLANYLTEWENHRTQSQFDRHRVTKLVLFEFVNNFMSLFYIAFIIQDMDMLRNQLAILLIILQVLNNFQEALLPFIMCTYSDKFLEVIGQKKKSEANEVEEVVLHHEFEFPVSELSAADPRVKQATREARMEPYEDPYDDYLEMFVQFGYVFLFSSVYPMAAFWAVLNNFFEIRSDAFKLCCVNQRPLARKVKDTGAWQRSFQVLCTLSVMTNCALLCLSPSLQGLARHSKIAAADWLLLFVGLEHLLLALRQVLHYAIPDKPEWVRVALATINYQSKQALKQQRLMKSKKRAERRMSLQSDSLQPNVSD